MTQYGSQLVRSCRFEVDAKDLSPSVMSRYRTYHIVVEHVYGTRRSHMLNRRPRPCALDRRSSADPQCEPTRQLQRCSSGITTHGVHKRRPT